MKDTGRYNQTEPHNFVSEAGRGCIIAHGVDVPWCLGHERINPRDYDADAVFPDLAVDPESGTLSVVNATGKTRVAYVTVYDHPVLKVDGTPHESGGVVDANGTKRPCVTFILLLPPRTILHAATLTDVTSEIDSDVQDWSEHPNPEDEHTQTLGFPLGGSGPYLCTQGENGSLTHFFSGNLHAIDFRCPIGTDVVAVADAVVVEVSHEETLSGIATSNLFKWNSVMLKVIDTRSDETSGNTAESGDGKDETHGRELLKNEDDLYVEYVHVNAGSACVSVGQVVKKGEKVCESGNVGFSPEPHLHFTAFRSRDATAPTVRVRFLGARDTPFLPVAGKWYDASGEAKEPPAAYT